MSYWCYYYFLERNTKPVPEDPKDKGKYMKWQICEQSKNLYIFQSNVANWKQTESPIDLLIKNTDYCFNQHLSILVKTIIDNMQI